MSEAVATEEVLSREEQKREPLYAGRVKVHPKSVRGRIRRIKWAALSLFLGVYYLAPWLRWDRGPGVPDQALLIDLPARRAYFFWIEIWPQEIYYIAVLLIMGAFGLFLATSIGGRVWCGYACPQTVWTDLFMWVERQIEGDRAARLKLDKAPLSAGKVGKKVLKHACWLFIAFATGGAWIMYFKDAPTLATEYFVGESSFSVYFFTGLFTTTTYLLAGWAREQVCTYMCPWPRFQAALLDEDSLVVTYREWRGEPRGKYRKGENWEGRGDCIDCKQCVAVCPTGIDIRDGLQLECIGWRALHRRLRRRHGQDQPSARPDRFRHGTQSPGPRGGREKRPGSDRPDAHHRLCGAAGTHRLRLPRKRGVSHDARSQRPARPQSPVRQAIRREASAMAIP